MGTRGLLSLIQRTQRHATYNHFDSYPTGLGSDTVAFIISLSEEEITTMFRNIDEITCVDDKTKPSPELQEHYSQLGFSSLAVSFQSLNDWYCLLHRTQGAAMLPAVKSGQLKHAVDSMDFLEDGLFCEWAYFIDFESKKLEVWKGEHGIGSSGKCVKVGDISFEELKVQGNGFMEMMEKIGSEDEVETGSK